MARKTSTTSSSTFSSALALTIALAACGGGGEDGGGDTALEGLELVSVAPTTVLPGSQVRIVGRSFVAAEWGRSALVLEGDFAGGAVELSLPAAFVDFDRMTVTADDAFFAAFPAAEGDFSGTAAIEVVSEVDGQTYRSEPLALDLSLRRELTPRLDAAAADGELIYVNDAIPIEGDGLLLGGGEGRTVAVVEGCFTEAGAGACQPISAIDVPVVPASATDRQAGAFAFVPGIAGISPGTFEGSIRLRNEHAGGAAIDSEELAVSYELIEPALFELSPPAASLGQFVDVSGGGFLGGDEGDGGTSLLLFSGEFLPDGSTEAVPVDLALVPQFVDGRLVRYVLNEDDELGQEIDLRRITGQFSGSIVLEARWQEQVVQSPPLAVELRLAPVKQVVHLVFEPGYVESLRHFGMRALDQRLREHIAAVVRRDYDTINLEVRLEEPTDFALYSVVEIGGADPNGLGLLGYDNSPGKDTNNERLFDRIGGVNAQTQMDGFPGYGGVFIESLFAFSDHPGGFADPLGDPEAAAFDDIFDPLRPDRGGTPVSSQDVAAGIVMPETGQECPATDRPAQIGCAAWTLGNLIGTTLSHEIGHSLGLANPFGQGFHNNSDEINRLMDSGGDRPFNERAELFGEGPGVFCSGAYDYLRSILPTDEPASPVQRPTCF